MLENITALICIWVVGHPQPSVSVVRNEPAFINRVQLASISVIRIFLTGVHCFLTESVASLTTSFSSRNMRFLCLKVPTTNLAHFEILTFVDFDTRHTA